MSRTTKPLACAANNTDNFLTSDTGKKNNNSRWWEHCTCQIYEFNLFLSANLIIYTYTHVKRIVTLQ